MLVWVLGFVPFLAGCELIGGGPSDDAPTVVLPSTGVQPQVFEGTARVGSLNAVSVFDAIPLFEGGEIEEVARVFARPPVGSGGDLGSVAAPGIETGYVERWVYRTPRVDTDLTDHGFIMWHDEGHPATCDTIEVTVSDLAWDTSSPQFSQQVLDYVDPPDEPGNPPLNTSEAATYVVHQPDDEGQLVIRGWMFRVISAAMQDHWLLTEDYEALGDGGTFAIVEFEEFTAVSEVDAWFASHAPEAASYAVTTYGISAFPDTCIAP